MLNNGCKRGSGHPPARVDTITVRATMTPQNELTDEELILEVLKSETVLSDLELELVDRLDRRVEADQLSDDGDDA